MKSVTSHIEIDSLCPVSGQLDFGFCPGAFALEKQFFQLYALLSKANSVPDVQVGLLLLRVVRSGNYLGKVWWTG